MEPFRIHTGLVAPMDRENVDTDAIIPKQFLKSIKRSGFGPNLFDAWRYLDPGEPGQDPASRRPNPDFVLNQRRFQGASVLLARKNFGCGSSREHAPQALMRWGINAIVGGSYAEIFFGNCTANGIPCLAADQADLDWLLRAVEKNPREAIDVDVERQEVRFMGRTIPARIPDGARNQLVSGSWNAMGVLLDAGDAIERTARALPYVAGF